MKITSRGQRRASAASKAKGAGALPATVMRAASKIFDDVAAHGRAALFRYTREFEGHAVTAGTVMVTRAEMERAMKAVPPADLAVIRLAARRIRAYHRLQAGRGFRFDDGKGTVIEERVVPLDRVGLCIPGGRAPLASTVLMTAIPAKIAGVKELVMINPWPGGRMNAHVIAAARIAGVDRIFKIGGAQGVAALACGAAPVPRVDKIVGPGSVWVTAAKAIAVSRGLCGIDSLAGPSEVVVVADGSADPGCVAADLLSQAEHGGDSVAILVTTSRSLAKKAGAELDALVKRGPWPRDVTARVRAIVVKGLAQAAEAVNDIAPEHLEIIVKNPRAFLKKVRNAASIFIGPYSPVPAGDYMAGGNHVLPTGGTARWSSPLSVHDFVKRQSITELSKAALASIKEPAARFAEIEGLPAHALAVCKRFSR